MPSYHIGRSIFELTENGCHPSMSETTAATTTTTTTSSTNDVNDGEEGGGGGGVGKQAPSGGTGRPNGGLGVPLAAAFLVAEMSGSGVLALPKALANTGWWGIILMVALCLSVGFAGTRLALCWVMLEERWEEYRVPCRSPYPAIAYRALGKNASYLTVAAQHATLLGVATVFLLLAAQLLAALTGSSSSGYSQCSYIIVLGLVLVPTTWMATPKDFWPASVVAVLVMLAQCLVVIGKIVTEASYLPPARYSQPSFSSFFLGFGTILFSFGGAATFPTIQNDMRDRAKFPYSVVIAFTILLVLYATMSAVGYGVLGADVSANVLLSVSGVEVTVVRSCIFVHLLFAFVIIFNPVAQGLEESLGVPREFGWRRCCLRSSVVAFEVVLGLAVPDFGIILNLIGGSTIAFMSFVMPPLCYLKLSDARDDQNKPRRNVGLIERAILIGVVLVGITGGGVTTYTAASAIIGPGALERSCFF